MVKFFKQFGSDIKGGLDLLTTGFTKPVQTFGRVFGKGKLLPLVQETRKEKPATLIKKTLVSSAVGTATLLGGWALLIPKTIGGVLIGTGIAGGVLASPKVAEFVEPTGLLEKAFRGGEIAGEVFETGKAPVGITEALKTGGLVGAGAVIGAGLVVGAEKVLEKAPTLTTAKEQFIPSKPIGIKGETAITPQTTTITTGKKPTRRRTAKKTPSVRQSVRVNISNKAIGLKINKRYINQELLC